MRQPGKIIYTGIGLVLIGIWPNSGNRWAQRRFHCGRDIIPSLQKRSATILAPGTSFVEGPGGGVARMIQHLALDCALISNLTPPMSLLSLRWQVVLYLISSTWKVHHSQHISLKNWWSYLHPSHPSHQQPPAPTPEEANGSTQWPVWALLNSWEGRLQLQ